MARSENAARPYFSSRRGDAGPTKIAAGRLLSGTQALARFSLWSGSFIMNGVPQVGQLHDGSTMDIESVIKRLVTLAPTTIPTPNGRRRSSSAPLTPACSGSAPRPR